MAVWRKLDFNVFVCIRLSYTHYLLDEVQTYILLEMPIVTLKHTKKLKSFHNTRSSYLFHIYKNTAREIHFNCSMLNYEESLKK